MSGTIKDLERVNSQQIEGLKRRLSREIKTMETGHQNYKAELKKSQEGEILDLQEENHRNLALEAEKKDRVLSDMKHHLHNTQRITDKQLKELETNSNKDRAVVQERLGLDREKTVTDNQLYLEELAHRFQAETRKINLEGKQQVSGMTATMNQDYSHQQGQLQKKINDQAMEFNTRFSREAMEHKKLKDQVDLQNKHLRMATNQRQQSDMAKLTETHNHFLDAKDVEFRKGLKEQDAFFEQRYAVNHASHTKDANSLDERYQGLMNKLKNDVAQEVTKTAVRLDDPFYHLTELRPSWKKTEEGVEVQVAIPEYAKQDLQLITNNKEVVLNFNRRFEESNKGQDGIANKVNKVETFTARIDTDTILNPKTVKSSYADGVMTYNIKRA